MQENAENIATEHRDDPDKPGWCALCRRAFPCPSTLTRAEARRLAIRFRHAR